MSHWFFRPVFFTWTRPLGTIHDAALRSLISCLEYQFDTVPIDRPVILKRLYQLFNCLLDRRVLTWSFFVTRFDLIINEVQNYDVHQKQLNESAMGLHNKESEPVSETSTDKPSTMQQQKMRHPTETVCPINCHIRLRVKSSQCHFGKKLCQRSSVDF